jgi:hypothetical protein
MGARQGGTQLEEQGNTFLLERVARAQQGLIRQSRCFWEPARPCTVEVRFVQSHPHWPWTEPYICTQPFADDANPAGFVAYPLLPGCFAEPQVPWLSKENETYSIQVTGRFPDQSGPFNFTVWGAAEAPVEIEGGQRTE